MAGKGRFTFDVRSIFLASNLSVKFFPLYGKWDLELIAISEVSVFVIFQAILLAL